MCNINFKMKNFKNHSFNGGKSHNQSGSKFFSLKSEIVKTRKVEKRKKTLTIYFQVFSK